MSESIETVTKIISKRDNITIEDARQIVQECLEEIDIAMDADEPYDIDEIWADWTGLEPDYLFDIMVDRGTF